MSLFSRTSQADKEDSKEIPKINKEGVEAKEKGLSRAALRKVLRDPSSRRVPGGGIVPRNERIKMEREIFGRKYGSYISDKDFKKAIGGLKKERTHAKTMADRIKIDRKIRLLEKIRRF